MCPTCSRLYLTAMLCDILGSMRQYARQSPESLKSCIMGLAPDPPDINLRHNHRNAEQPESMVKGDVCYITTAALAIALDQSGTAEKPGTCISRRHHRGCT